MADCALCGNPIVGEPANWGTTDEQCDTLVTISQIFDLLPAVIEELRSEVAT